MNIILMNEKSLEMEEKMVIFVGNVGRDGAYAKDLCCKISISLNYRGAQE
jgi:hypothetical protein